MLQMKGSIGPGNKISFATTRSAPLPLGTQTRFPYHIRNVQAEEARFHLSEGDNWLFDDKRELRRNSTCQCGSSGVVPGNRKPDYACLQSGMVRALYGLEWN
jgi:hypothetical protein